MKGIAVVVAVLLFAAFAVADQAPAPERPYQPGIPVRVRLVSSWPSTPLSLEASEFVSKEVGSDSFWRFVTSLSFAKGAKPSDSFSSVVSAASALLTPSKAALLTVSLGSRVHSPTVELFRHLLPRSPRPKSAAFSVVDGRVFVDPSELSAAIGATAGGPAETEGSVSVPGIVDGVDHVFPGAGAMRCSERTAVLYAHVGTAEFSAMHAVLSKASDEGKVCYVLRHAWGDGDGVVGANSSLPVSLGGYGVEFALKSVEYKTIDEQSKPQPAGGDKGQKQPQAQEQADVPEEFGSLEYSDRFDRMTAEELQEIGFRAVSYIAGAADPLKAMAHLSHNFPSLAVAVAKIVNNNTAVRKSVMIGRALEAGTNMVVLNGRLVEKPKDDWFSILDLVSSEISRAEMLRDVGISAAKASALFARNAGGNSGDSAAQLRFDIRSPAITFVNDLEKDRQYGRFPKSVEDFLRPIYPGQLHYVAKNLFTVIAVVDPSDKASVDMLANFRYFVLQMLPMRVGLLFDVPASSELHGQRVCDESGQCTGGDAVLSAPRAAAMAFHYLKERHSVRDSMSIFSHLSELLGDDARHATVDDVRAAFASAVAEIGGNGVDFDEALGSTAAAGFADSNAEYVAKAGLKMATPIVFVNGVPVDDLSHAGRIIGRANADHSPMLTQLIRDGTITDATEDIYGAILGGEPTALPRYSPMVVPSANRPLRFKSLLVPKTSAERAAVDGLRYFSDSSNANSLKLFTHVVCADLGGEYGRTLAAEALNSVAPADGKSPSRVAIFSTDADSDSEQLWASITAAADVAAAKEAIVSFGSGHRLTGLRVDQALLSSQRSFCSSAMAGVAGAVAAVVTNGRVTVLKATDSFTSFDFALMERFERPRVSRVVLDVETLDFVGVDPDAVTADLRSDALMTIVSVLGSDEVAGVKKTAVPASIEPSFETGAPAEAAVVTIDAVLNPLSPEAQRFSPILSALASVPGLPVRVRVFVNPLHTIESLPLKRFYHYVLNTEQRFDPATGALLPQSGGVIRGLPAARLITLGMDVPHPWIAMAVEAKHDLDNIRLDEAAASGDESVDAVFRLEHILVEGNCRDASTQVPPRGLELELATTPDDASGLQQQQQHYHSDTLVMSNFGYFQLKANPGVWLLSISEGRSSKLYSIAASASESKVVTVGSFLGVVVDLPVTKRPGHEKDSLLVAEGESADEPAEQQEPPKPTKSLWEKLWGKPERSGPSDEQKKPTDAAALNGKRNVTGETINVFSIASGHLYERFIKIMMLSVVRKSSAPVKFWFIKNYLSPGFKESIPRLAEHFGFEYELVTYKWPAWLWPQTEKQRLIWGYKILFLDVLFPIGLKKVVYVDADQVVRGDLKELTDLPLYGAPIGMTPFCQGDAAKKETWGYRFWEQGYWHEHLRGKPYHISALFVVDLVKFRRVAAGDQYRAHYDGLARDPNSLANLDQDLPNYLQHNVRMRSLPQEWLWCESWCNEESKKKAKTIDLCNNPMTKVPKLEAAQRIIEEWKDLDNAVREAEK